MFRNRPRCRLVLALSILLLLSSSVSAYAEGAAPATTWFGRLIDYAWTLVRTAPAETKNVVAGDDAFPNIDPDGLQEPTDGEAFPNIDPDGLRGTADDETSPMVAPNA